MQIRDFIPPILLRAVRRAKNHSSRVFSSYHEAALMCSSYGYEQGALLNVVCEKTKRYRDWLNSQKPLEIGLENIRTALGLSLSRSSNELRVIDFGGACGAHYFIAKALFGNRVSLHWHVVETSGMVRKGMELENGELRFFDNLTTARQEIGHVDLVFSSGALQYVEDPYKILKDLVECEARCIFLTRLALTTKEQALICIQESRFSENGPGALPKGMHDELARYPITAASRDSVEKILSDKYEIRMRFLEDKGPFQLTAHSIEIYGFYGEIKSAAL
jgi:putative methyltransferase (TIGR04325 family)